MKFSRRQILSGTSVGALFALSNNGFANIIRGQAPWEPNATNLPETFEAGKLYFLTQDEAQLLGALVERLIPADELSKSGKDLGCVDFIDRQLAGWWGTYERYYMQGPFQPGEATQGDQSQLVPRERYRLGLAGLKKYCSEKYDKAFIELMPEQRDQILTGLEKGEIKLEGIDSKLFFEILLSNTMEGYFADPIYGGNKDMASWKMLGFPGARYDYRDYVERHNEKLEFVPLSIGGSKGWR